MKTAIKRVETNTEGKAFCVIYASGIERFYLARTLPKTAYEFMKKAVADGRCGKWENPLTKEVTLYCY